MARQRRVQALIACVCRGVMRRGAEGWDLIGVRDGGELPAAGPLVLLEEALFLKLSRVQLTRRGAPDMPANTWTAQMHIRLLDPRGHAAGLAVSRPLTFDVAQLLSVETVDLMGLTLKHEGPYAFEVTIDGEPIALVPFAVSPHTTVATGDRRLPRH